MGKLWSAGARSIAAERAQRRAALGEKLTEYGEVGPLGSVDPKDFVGYDMRLFAFFARHLMFYAILCIGYFILE